MAGEELPPVVATLVGDDESFLAMLERDIEAARAFAAQLQDALDEGIGGITVSGAQISGQGIGAAGEAIGEQFAAGFEEAAGGLNLSPEMQGAAATAAEAGQAAGDEFSSGFAEAAVSGGDAAAAGIAEALGTGVTGAASAAGEHIVAGLADAGTHAGAEIGSGVEHGLATAGGRGAAALAAGLAAGAAPIGPLLAGEIGAGLFVGLPAAARPALSRLGDSLAEGTAGTGEQMAAQIGSGLRGALPGIATDAAARLSDAMVEGTYGTGDALAEQIGSDLRAGVTEAGQLAGTALTDALLESTAGIGDALAGQIGSGVEGALAGGGLGEAGAVAGMMTAAADEMQAAGEEAGARYVGGFEQTAMSLRDWRLGPQPLPSDMPEAADPFVQDPDSTNRMVRRSILEQEEAVRQQAADLAASARNALIDTFSAPAQQVTAAQLGAMTETGLSEWIDQLRSRAQTAGMEFSEAYATALQQQFGAIDWSSATDEYVATLQDLLVPGAEGAGEQAATALGSGLTDGISATLADDAAFVRAAADAGMAQPMIEAVQNLRAGVVDITASIPEELIGAFEGIKERFAEEGTQAGTAYALSLQESLNTQAASLRPPTKTQATPDYVDLSANIEQWKALDNATSAEAGGMEKAAASAASAGGSFGGLAGVMNGPLMTGLMGATMIASLPMMISSLIPMVEGWAGAVTDGGYAAQVASLASQQLGQSVQQDSGFLGDNTAATIENILVKSNLTDMAGKLGVSQAQLIEYAAGESDAQSAVSAAYDKSQSAVTAYMGIRNANTEAQLTANITLKDEKKALDELTASTTATINADRDHAQALAAAEQTNQIYTASIEDLVAKMQLQAQQAHMNADAQGAYLMSLVPGSQAYTYAIDDQIIALRQNAVTADINAQALNESLAPQAQLSGEAVDAASAYQQASTATGAYTNALTALYGQYGQTSAAEAAAGTAIDNLSGHITSGTDAVDLSTAAGRKNVTAFQQAASAAEAYAGKVYQTTGSTQQADQVMQDFATKIDHAAAEAHLTTGQIHELNVELFGVPDVKDITVHLDKTPAEQQMSALSGFIQGEIDSLNAKPINLFLQDEISYVNSAPPNLYGGGRPLSGRAAGGPVTQGDAYWVGERGQRELFVAGADGYITPQDMLTPAFASVAAPTGGGVAAGGVGGITVFAPIYLDGRLIGQAVTPGTRAGAQQFARHNAITGMAGNYS